MGLVKINMDNGYAWVVLGAAFGIEVIAGMFVGCVGFITKAIVDEIDSNLTRASLVSSTMLGTFTLFGPLAGLIQDRIGHRLTGIISGTLMLIGLTAACFCRSTLGLVFTFGVITGLGLGLAVNLSGVAPGNYFLKKLPVAYGVSMSGGGLGLLVIGPFTIFLLRLYNLPGTLLIMGGVGFHVCLAGSLIRPNPQTGIVQKETFNNGEEGSHEADVASNNITGNRTPDDIEAPRTKRHTKVSSNIIAPLESRPKEKNETLETDGVKAQFLSNSVVKSFLYWFSVLRSNGFFLYALSTLFWSMGESACFVHLPNYVEQKGSTPFQSASVLTSLGVASMLSGILAGFTASDESIGTVLLHTGFQGLSGVLNILLPLYSHTYPLQMLFGALYGMYSQASYSLIGPICIELAGLRNLAVAYGLSSFSLGVGYLIGPPISSLLYEETGVYDYTFVFAGCSMVASAFSAAFIPIFQRKQNKS